MTNSYKNFSVLYANSMISDTNDAKSIILFVLLFVLVSICFILIVHIKNINREMFKYQTARKELQEKQKSYLEKKKKIEDYNKLLELQSAWRKSKELSELGEKDEYIIYLAKEKGISPTLFIELQKNNVRKYEEYHREYNNKYNVDIPFPTK